MKNIYHLIQKNLKLLIRSKSSALIVIFAPLIIILLVGLSYNTSQTGLNIGIHSPDYTTEIESFILTLQEEDYKIVKYDIETECVEDIKLGFIHTCLVLPPDFQIQDNSPKEILFYIDQTKINLVYLITDTLSTKFNLKSKELSQMLTSEILTKLSNTQTKISEKSSQLESAKTKNLEAASQSTTLGSEFSSLDFSFAYTSFNASLANTFKTNTTTQLSDSLDLIDTTQSTIASSNLNESDKTAIQADLTEIEDKLENIDSLIKGTGEGSFGKISNLLSSLKIDLDLAKNKLTAADEKVSGASTQLTSLAATLNDGLSTLENIQTTLNEIKDNLASQKVTDPGTVSAPLTTRIERVSVEKTHLNYLFPSLMVLVVMFISILLGTNLVMMEKHNQAYFRNFILPVKKTTFVLANYLTNSFLVLIQIIIIAAIALTFIKDLLPQLPLIIFILFISSSIFTLIGMAIGYLFTSEDTGTLASISCGALLLFVSGVILPLESMPTLVRNITAFNPFVISEKVIREIFIFNTSFLNILNDVLLLIGYAVIFFVLILIIDILSSKHSLTKILYKHHKHERERKAKTVKIPIKPR